MANKTTFTPEEWRQLLEGVMMSSMAVSAADPSGLWGMLKEGFASAGALADIKAKGGSNELIKAIVDDFGTSEGRSIARDGLKETFSGAKAPEIKTRSIESLRQLSTLLDTKAPADAAEVKTWLRDIAQRVAEASKEGGFLFFGGERVSEAERATLDEISSTLNVRT